MAHTRRHGLLSRFTGHLGELLRGGRPAPDPFRSLAENSNDPIARFDCAGRYLYVNPAHCALVGLEAREILGRDCRQIGAPPHAAELFQRHVREVALTATERKFEIALPGTGGPRWFEARLMPEPGADGNVATILSVQREITERRQLEQRRQELERQQRALLDGIAERAWLKDLSGRYLAVNQQFAHLTGYSRQDLIGKTVWDILPPTVAAKCEAEDREAMEQGRVLRAERHSLLDKYRTWRETIKVPLRNSSGRVIGLICSSRDITSHKLASDRLEAGEQRLKLALRAAKSGVWEWQPGASDSYWSDEAYAVVGLEPGHAPPAYATWLARIHDDDRARVRSSIERCARDGTEFRAEYRVVLDDGTVRWVSDVGVMYGDGDSRRMIGINTDITDRKLIEKKQHELEYAQQALLDGIADSAWLKDLEGRFLAVNSEYERRAGLGREEILGRKTADIRPQDMASIFVEEDQQVIRTGRPLRTERAVSLNDRTFWREMIKVPIKDEQDRVIGTAGVSRDVTERKRIEQALQQSNEMLNTILGASPSAIIAYDTRLDVTFWNPAAERMFGWTAREVMGRALPTLPPENRGDMEALQHALLQHEMLTNVETVWQKRDGLPVEILLSGAAIHDATGRVAGSVVICVNVTERNREQRALMASEEQFRLLAEDVQAVFWIGDRGFTKIDYISPGFDGLWGRRREEVYREPKAWIRGIHPEDQPMVQEFLQTQARGIPASLEARIVRSGNDIRWIRARSFPHRSGRLGDCVTGIINDITDVKAVAADRLARVERQRDVLVREVHHRIKNHLQGVAGLLRLHASEAPAAAGVLERAITQIQSVAIIHGLQGLRGGNEVVLCEMVPAIVQMMRALSNVPADVTTEALVEQPVRVAENEAVPVALIITELVNNAVKHSNPLGSPVKVTVTTERDSALIRIANSGRLDADANKATAKVAGSTGLELVRALMPPRGATLELVNDDAGVEARLALSYPTVISANQMEHGKTGGNV